MHTGCTHLWKHTVFFNVRYWPDIHTAVFVFMMIRVCQLTLTAADFE